MRLHHWRHPKCTDHSSKSVSQQNCVSSRHIASCISAPQLKIFELLNMKYDPCESTCANITTESETPSGCVCVWFPLNTIMECQSITTKHAFYSDKCKNREEKGTELRHVKNLPIHLGSKGSFFYRNYQRKDFLISKDYSFFPKFLFVFYFLSFITQSPNRYIMHSSNRYEPSLIACVYLKKVWGGLEPKYSR